MTSWNYHQPSIYIGNLRIDEPVVFLTNLLITVVCWFAYFRLKKLGESSSAQKYFRLYFLLMGAATLLGGFFGHAFLYAFGFSWKIPGWTMSMVSVTMFSLGSINTTKPFIDKGVNSFFFLFAIVEFVVAWVVTITTINFRWVELHSTFNLILLVIPFHIYNYRTTKKRGSLVIISAIAVISMSAIVFVNKISLGVWFNHLDISHVFIAIGTYMFYRGVVLLRLKD